MEFKFKKTWNGMVLYKMYRVPTDSPGEFKTKWRKATEYEANTFYYSIIEDRIERGIMKDIKKSNPYLVE